LAAPKAHTRQQRRRLAASFEAVAGDYDFGRPAYPANLVRWALGSEPLHVLDVGAGTGKLTQVIVGRGHSVTAAEPLPGMARFLARRLTEVETIEAYAEDLPVASEAFDAIVVGQAFHWFDYARALSEMARVARPGAILGLFWNVYAGVDDWLPYPRQVPEEPLRALQSHSMWTDVEHRAHAWNFRVTKKSIRAFIRSHSSVAVLPPARRNAYTADLATRADLVAREGSLPLVTHVWRCRLAA
jgi:ubiquinone/menaquinone biosynthesis C-methylase UbiE